MGRMAKKRNIKKQSNFCAEASSYITGQNIVSDGGKYYLIF